MRMGKVRGGRKREEKGREGKKQRASEAVRYMENDNEQGKSQGTEENKE